MATKKQVGWRKLFLILTVLPCCRSLEVSIPEPEYMVARGGDVALTCSFIPARTDFNTIVLRWDVDPEEINAPMESVATYFVNNPIDIAPAFEGRATLEVDLQNRVSTLTLKKVTIRDSRRFQCNVLIPNDDEGNTAASTSLLVLVPPSPPVCSINGRAEYWNDISLTCSSEEGSPQPVYEWKSFDVRNAPRAFPPKTTEKDGVLSLFNISRETSGIFTCTSTNRVGTASCNFTLAVTPGGMSEGSVAGIAVGVLAGFLVLGIVVFCCWRKKGKKDKYAEGAPAGVEFYDRDAPEAEERYLDNETSSETKQHKQHEEKEAALRSTYTAAVGHTFDDDQNSHSGKGSDIDSKRYRDDKPNHYPVTDSTNNPIFPVAAVIDLMSLVIVMAAAETDSTINAIVPVAAEIDSMSLVIVMAAAEIDLTIHVIITVAAEIDLTTNVITTVAAEIISMSLVVVIGLKYRDDQNRP
ncbi:unnamed protein product [Pleuronectes platessa]|uniref:Ig-like domain-containing protein n=1 Tax=Pleuronectes platessa TaxID=8262 RepID=A0A9N7UQ56_PLEPL|nr:unnamed protein product [Pleuronectes platessa]